MVFELLTLLLNTPTDALYWIKLTDIAYEKKKKNIYSPQPAWNRNPNKKLQQFLSLNETMKTSKTFLKSRWKIMIWYDNVYDITTDHVFKGNYLIPVYSLWVLWFRVKFLPTDKYLFKYRDLLKTSKSGSEAASKEVASLHLKPKLSKSQCTGTIKSIINEVVFE